MIEAQACANIALIKYWGKRDESRFLPTKSSLSISVPHLQTVTHIEKIDAPHDIIQLNQQTLPKQNPIVDFLNFFRRAFAIDRGVRPWSQYLISSENSFPTAAGLASSSSGFAALTKGLDKLHDLRLSPKELSILARHGSGSACRSIQSGFVLWHKGEKPNGSDSYAEQLFDETHWPELQIIVVPIDTTPKKISSRLGMQQTVMTSPDYNGWIKRSEERIKPMIDAIKHKDIKALGELAEADCLEMHHCMRTTQPSLDYWQEKTWQVIKHVQKLRQSGIPCYFTIDAGPNVKIITLEKLQKIRYNA